MGLALLIEDSSGRLGRRDDVFDIDLCRTRRRAALTAS